MEPFHGAKAAVFVGDRLLVYRRDDLPGLPFPDHWDFPGGGREGDETPEQTLFREIEEEFGLTPGPETIRWKRRFDGVSHPGHHVWFFVLALPPEQAASVRFGDEGQEWRLMRWEEFDRQPKSVPSFRARMRIWLAETGGALD